MKKVYLSILFLIIFLTGCTSSVPLKLPKKDRNEINIDTNVKLTDKITYRGLWDSALEANLGNALGYIAAQNKRLTASQAIKLSLEKNKINIKEILVSKIEAELKTASLFQKISKNSNTFPTLLLEIEFYGLLVNLSIADSRVKPYMDVTATLVDKDGNILWKKRDFVSNATSQTTPYHLKFFLENNAIQLKKGYEKASEIIAKGLISHMKKQ